MASKKKKDYNGTIVTIDRNGEVVRTTPEQTKQTVTKVNSNTSNLVSQPTVEAKQTVKMPTLNTRELANKNYEEKLALFNKATEDLDKKRVEELNKRNIDLTRRLDKQDFRNQVQNGKVVDKRSLEQQQRQYDAFAPRLAELTQAEDQNRLNARNDLRLATYQKDLADVEADEIGLIDKAATPFLSGIGDLFSSITDENKYIDENGNEIYLPTKNDLKYQKVRDSYGNGYVGNLFGNEIYVPSNIRDSNAYGFLGDVMRFGGDVTHELGKQAGTSILDKLTFGVGGKALYYTDIVSDQYKQNINEGYNQQEALADAVVKGFSNYVKQKFIGGTIGKKLTGTKDASWLEKALTNKFAQYVSNPRVVSILANLSSEGLDEFTDTYVEAGIDALVLGKKINFDDLFKDALYSGAIGAATGGVSGALNVSPETRQAVYNQQQNRLNQNQNTQPTTRTETPQIQTNEQENTNTQLTPQNVLDSPKVTNSNEMSDNLRNYFDLKEKYDEGTIKLEDRNNVISKLNELEDKLTPQERNEVYKRESQNLNTNNTNTQPRVEQQQMSLNETSNEQTRNDEQEEQNLIREINIEQQKLDTGKSEDDGYHLAELQKELQDRQKKSIANDSNTFNLNKVDENTSLESVRTSNEIKNPKTNAFQYDNPEVKPYFKEAAQELKYALNEGTFKGERFMRDDGTWGGQKFSSTPEIAELHNDYKMSYKDLQKGIDGIINDMGRENNASSKKVEVVIDKMLRNGYKPLNTNETVGPNQNYLNTLEGDFDPNTVELEATDEIPFVHTMQDEINMGLREAPTTQRNTQQTTQTQTTQETQTNENNNIPERKSEDVIKYDLDKEADNIVKKFDSAKKGDVFSQVEEEQGRPLRQGVKTITTATGTTQLVSDMDGSVITYEPTSNQKTLDKSYARNKGKSLEQRYNDNLNFIKSDKRITADNIADIETLLVDLKNNFNDQKNIDMFIDLTQQAATLGTTDAQALQFMSVIKKLSPTAQLDTLTKMIETSKAKGDKTFDGVELNKDLVKKVLESQNNEAEFNKAMENLKDDIAKQMKVGFIERLNAFRFLSMLGNFKTHIRNMLGNGLMYELQSVKDTIGSGIETVYDKTSRALGGKGLQERSKATLGSLRASKEVRQFVNNKVDDFFKTQETNKYNDSSSGLTNDIKRRRKMFTEATPIGKALNKLNTLNSNLLTKEDTLFSKPMTKKAMKSFLVANGIKTDADIEANPELIGRALDYAFFKGQEATYHQDSTTANMISHLKEQAKTGSGFTKLGGLAVEATMPFVKTPVNIAKTSLEYTPLAGFGDLVYQFKHSPKELRGAVVIDNLSKQFTGLALMGVGIALANSKNIKIKGAGEGDKEDKIEKSLGASNYSIQIEDSTYDLSWVSPTAIPLFEGVELYNKFGKNEKFNADTVIDTLFGALDPVTDMSVLQSIERLGKAIFSSSNDKKGLFSSVASQTFSSYLSQYIPTLLAQLAQATDENQRDTYSSTTTLGKTWDSIKYKIPGARQTLPESVDIWGETNKNNKNEVLRFAEAFFAPANRKYYKVDKTTKELEKLSKQVGNTDVLPTERQRAQTISGKNVRLEGKEYVEYKKAFGKNAKKQMGLLLNSQEYKNASDETKRKMVTSLYDYASYKAKKQYADNNNIDYTDKNGNKYAMVDAFNVPYYEYATIGLSDLSKKDETMEAIENSDLTEEQKDMLNLIQNYKYYDANVNSLINRINNSNLSKSQKEQLIAKIKKNSTKGGK